MSKATVIKAKPYKKLNGKTVNKVKKVAAYCRVSTDSEEQLNSYQAQVSHYTALIQNNSEWELVDIYADEGISGTNSERRPEFQRMIKDAKSGKIDLILTKSISRFGRNTVDILRYTRELKEHGVAVNFEKENINTMEASGEIFLTIFSSLAQEESRNISENSRWGIVKGFKDGKVFCNTKRFLGYDKDENKNLVINQKEAEIVRRIYNEYLQGKSYLAIAKGLEEDGIKTGAGKTKWWDSTISGILSNEKYVGDLLQQKTVTVNYLSGKRVRNEGFADQYLIENNHEPIISREIFEAVQKEKERRASLVGNKKGDRSKYSSKYPFSGKVICGSCTSNFKRRHWNSGTPSEKIVWQCRTYINKGKQVCDMKAVGEKVLEDAFVKVFNELKIDKKNFFKTLIENIEKIIESNGYHKEMERLKVKIEETKNELKNLVKLQATGKVDLEVYNEEYERISNELNKLRGSASEFENDENRKQQLKQRIQDVIDVINGREELLEQFDSDIFNALVDKIEIITPTHFSFVLKSGVRVEQHNH